MRCLDSIAPILLLVFASCGPGQAPGQSGAARPQQNRCAPRCECGPPDEYTWCCDCAASPAAPAAPPAADAPEVTLPLWTTDVDLRGDGKAVPIRITVGDATKRGRNNGKSLFLSLGDHTTEAWKAIDRTAPTGDFSAVALQHESTRSSLLIVHRSGVEPGRFAAVILQAFADGGTRPLPWPLISFRARGVPVWRLLPSGELEVSYEACVNELVETNVLTFEVLADAAEHNPRLRFSKTDQTVPSSRPCTEP